jgi:hypothetical protein
VVDRNPGWRASRYCSASQGGGDPRGVGEQQGHPQQHPLGGADPGPTPADRRVAHPGQDELPQRQAHLGAQPGGADQAQRGDPVRGLRTHRQSSLFSPSACNSTIAGPRPACRNRAGALPVILICLSLNVRVGYTRQWYPRRLPANWASLRPPLASSASSDRRTRNDVRDGADLGALPRVVGLWPGLGLPSGARARTWPVGRGAAARSASRFSGKSSPPVERSAHVECRVRNVTEYRRAGTGGMLCCHTDRAQPASR